MDANGSDTFEPTLFEKADTASNDAASTANDAD
jgi:hypothetical protein